MKINPVSTVVGQYQKIQTYSRTEKQEYSSLSDKLELSDQAKLFTEALSAAKKDITVSQASKQQRVEEIRAQINDASYSVDIDDLCKKIMMV